MNDNVTFIIQGVLYSIVEYNVTLFFFHGEVYRAISYLPVFRSD